MRASLAELFPLAPRPRVLPPDPAPSVIAHPPGIPRRGQQDPGNRHSATPPRTARARPIMVSAPLALLGTAVTITAAIANHTPRWPRRPSWPPDINPLVTRGAHRWQRLLNQPQVADTLHRLARWSRRVDQRVQADIDELSDRGEELLAHAELLRWRSRRIVERAFKSVSSVYAQITARESFLVRQP